MFGHPAFAFVELSKETFFLAHAVKTHHVVSDEGMNIFGSV